METPSGNVNLTDNAKLQYVYDYNDFGHYEYESSHHVKTLWKDGQPHVHSSHFSDTQKTPFGTCTSDADYHFAGNAVQYDNFEINCV